MPVRPITIHSPCYTKPDEHVHVTAGDRIRWRADHAEIYLLKIRGGFFLDQPDPFDIWVFGPVWTDEFEVAGPVGSFITNYIYSLSGSCSMKKSDGPPDIVIDNSIPDSERKRAPKKKKEK